MKVHLIRHGKPVFWNENNLWSIVAGQDLRRLWNTYEVAGIMSYSKPSAELVQRVQSARHVYCSDMRRAAESAQKLPLDAQVQRHTLFREIGFPHGFWKSIKLPIFVWAVLTRSLWILGYARNCESLSEAQHRADQAATILACKAEECQEVILVGHAWINCLIFYSLKNAGWQADERFKHTYWACNTICWDEQVERS
jgi:broad specificity phosphatase PhoE